MQNITGVSLDNYPAFDMHENVTNDEALQLAGGSDVEAFYAQLGAAVYNVYYGVDKLDYIEPATAFKPTDVKFHGDGIDTAPYIVDWGNIAPPTIQQSGVVWKITHEPWVRAPAGKPARLLPLFIYLQSRSLQDIIRDDAIPCRAPICRGRRVEQGRHHKAAAGHFRV